MPDRGIKSQRIIVSWSKQNPKIQVQFSPMVASMCKFFKVA